MKTLTLILILVSIICAALLPICTMWYAVSLDYDIKSILYLCFCISSFSCVAIYILVKLIKEVLS